MTYAIISVKWRINRRGFTTLSRLSVLKTARCSKPINFLVARVDNKPLPSSQYNLGQYRFAFCHFSWQRSEFNGYHANDELCSFPFLYFHSKTLRKYVTYRCVCLLWVLNKGSVILEHSRPSSVSNFSFRFFLISVLLPPLLCLHTSALTQYIVFCNWSTSHIPVNI